MSNTIRPVRRAAQLAAIRISEFCQNDNANSDSDKSAIHTPNYSASENKYDNAIYVIRYLLDELENTEFEDERTEIAIKMFKFINYNPNILKFEPRFRDIVLKKINEINENILKKNEMYNKAEYNKAIKMLKFSMLMNIRNNKMRMDIYKHLNEISLILNKYSTWSERKQLKSEMNKVSCTVQNIIASTQSVDLN